MLIRGVNRKLFLSRKNRIPQKRGKIKVKHPREKTPPIAQQSQSIPARKKKLSSRKRSSKKADPTFSLRDKTEKTNKNGHQEKLTRTKTKYALRRGLERNCSNRAPNMRPGGKNGARNHQNNRVQPAREEKRQTGGTRGEQLVRARREKLSVGSRAAQGKTITGKEISQKKDRSPRGSVKQDEIRGVSDQGAIHRKTEWLRCPLCFDRREKKRYNSGKNSDSRKKSKAMCRKELAASNSDSRKRVPYRGRRHGWGRKREGVKVRAKIRGSVRPLSPSERFNDVWTKRPPARKEGGNPGIDAEKIKKELLKQ